MNVQNRITYQIEALYRIFNISLLFWTIIKLEIYLDNNPILDEYNNPFHC